MQGDDLVFTVFPSDKDTQGIRGTGLTDLFDSLRDVASRETPKTSLPMWSMTNFRNDVRHGDNALSVSGLCFDVDEEPVSLATIREAMDGFSGFVTTSSSSTIAAPRWHLVIFA